MRVPTRKKRGGIKTSLQLALLSTFLVAFLILLSMGLFISRYVEGTTALLFLLVICVAIIILMVATLTITAIAQRRIENIFLDSAMHFRHYSEGDHSARATIYGNDAFSLLTTTMNALLERQNRYIEELKFKQTEPTMTTVHNIRGRGTSHLRPVEPVQSRESKQKSVALAQQTQHGSQQLSRALRTMVDRTTFQEQTARAQSIQIFQTTEKIENLALSLHQLARNVQGSASLAQAGLSRLQRSDATMDQAIEEMSELQKETQRAAQQVYRLGEHTYAINSLATTIEQVTLQITMLGEHMRALKDAPEKGSEEWEQQFSELVQDIQTLATQATDSAGQVVHLTSTVESESQKAVVALQESNREVTDKARQIKESGQMLQDLYRGMEFQASMLQDMTQSVHEQTQIIDDASVSMGQIAKMAYQTNKETQQNMQNLKKMANYADRLAITAAQQEMPLLKEHSREDEEPPQPGQISL